MASINKTLNNNSLGLEIDLLLERKGPFCSQLIFNREKQENSLKTPFSNKLEIFKYNVQLLVMMQVPVKQWN